MGATEDLLRSMPDEVGEDGTVYLTIDPDTRVITIPSNEKTFGVETDKDSERKYFRCPRIVGDNIDLSQHKIYISYVSTTSKMLKIFPKADGSYWCDDVAVDGDYITFSWKLSGNVFKEPGFVAFKVLAKKTDGDVLKTRWNTAPAFGTVLLTVPDGESVEERYPDIVTQLLERMDAVEAIATKEAMQGYVNEYLGEHPVQLDETLTDNAKAAPAGIVGELKGDLVDIRKVLEVYGEKSFSVEAGKTHSSKNDQILCNIKSGEETTVLIDFTSVDGITIILYKADGTSHKSVGYSTVGYKKITVDEDIVSVGVYVDNSTNDVANITFSVLGKNSILENIDNALNSSKIEAYLSGGTKISVDGEGISFGGDLNVVESGEKYSFSVESIVSLAVEYGFTATDDGKGFVGNNAWFLYFNTETKTLEFYDDFKNSKFLYPIYWYRYGNIGGKLSDFNRISNLKSIIGIDNNTDVIEAELKTLQTKSNVCVYLSDYNDFGYDGNKLTFNSDVVIRPLSRNDDDKRFTPENILDEAEVFGFTVDRSNKSFTGSDRFGFYFDISTNKIGFTESWIYDANKVILFFYSYRTVFGKLIDYYNTKKSKSNTLKIADLETKLNDGVPSYFVNHLNEKIEVIRQNMMKVGRHGETCIFITDIHWDNSERNSPYLIRKILNQVSINTLLCGGDLINEGTYDEMRKDMGECVRSYNYPNTFFPVAFGNHDSNKNNGNPESEYFDEDAEYALMQKQAENYITYWSNGWNFYFDVKFTKTRYIVVDTNENGSFNQYSDLYEVLNSTDDYYHIVICGHWFFNDNAKSAFANNLETIIDAYNSKSTITIANTSMNFSNAKAEICFVIGGHVHNDITWNTPNGIPFILSDCDNGRRTRNTEYPYVKGTITEHAFDVVTIDYTNRTIKSVRVGRGIDREWSY